MFKDVRCFAFDVSGYERRLVAGGLMSREARLIRFTVATPQCRLSDQGKFE